MKVPVFRCPHCNNDLGFAMDAYLYGSPLQQCKKCKKLYVDNRYHEIAIEGIRQEDINPTDTDKKNHKQSGLFGLLIGVGMIALFLIILTTGWAIIPLPIFGVISIIGGIAAMTGDNKRSLEKTRKALEVERQQSILRMQNPQYVAQLQAMGYRIPQQNIFEPLSDKPINQPGDSVFYPVGAPTGFCGKCRTPLDGNDKFCPKCGNPR